MEKYSHLLSFYSLFLLKPPKMSQQTVPGVKRMRRLNRTLSKVQDEEKDIRRKMQEGKNMNDGKKKEGEEENRTKLFDEELRNRTKGAER